MFNVDDITLGQMERFETISGMAFADLPNLIDDLQGDTMPPVRTLKGMAYLVKAADGIELSESDLDNFKISDLLAAVGDLDAAGEAPPA